METTTYEGRRQMDKVATRAAADLAAAESKKTNALADIEISEAREAARDRDRKRKEAAKTQKAAEKAKRQEKKAAARKARNERIAAAVGQPLPWVMIVVVASIAVAWPGQYEAVTSLGMEWFLALLVPLFIEGATWSMAWMTKWAVENKKPTALYRVMTWTFAVVAAGLNASHHIDKPDLAVTMALSSMVGVVVWEIYMTSQHHKVGGRSGEEIKLALQRRIKHRKVFRRAQWLRTATVPPLSEAEAWERAWRQVHGAEPGVTQSILKRHGKLSARVAGLVEQHDGLRPTASLALFDAPAEPVREVPAGEGWMIDPQAIRKILADPANALRAGRSDTSAKKIKNGTEGHAQKGSQGPHASNTRAKNAQVTPNNPPSVRGRQKGADEGGAKQSRAARALAAETARAATPEQAEAEKKTAREWVLERLRAGTETGWRDVQRYFAKEIPEEHMRMVRGETWCRQRIKEAEQEHGADPALHLVAKSG
ncbi:DUF2637 domain-containing protein [Streptomyces ipomoeae]|uniref:DUF2637 domain-containing protein n=1 Tax=Streptomyces ipomoeae TaxID=103232 RepID=UPI0029B82EBA|nr:DUF2637 domain-containing protein [Streptomyces ipomoeae]MDX2697158.1 DUF2637 domain-containing protein [Streptomyces ipomoeae]MDX2843068.1 DUF2637 domain-containing protein [Streptomyces ipomoeae]